MAKTDGVWRGYKAGDWWSDSDDPGDACTASDPLGARGSMNTLLCTRLDGHPGRHIATAAAGTVALAAWPGAHEPTTEDLS